MPLPRPMPPRPSRALLALALAVGPLACGGGSAPVGPTGGGDLPGGVAGERAWAELEALAALGSRPAGSEAAAAARRHIQGRLEAAGLAVRTVETSVELPESGPLTLTHLSATLPGASPDRFVLVSAYDSGRYDEFEFVGANDGASGAALLLELARVLAGRELPYTVELVWLEGEGRLGRGGPDERELRWLGSGSLARQWAAEGRLAGIRLLVAFNRVCDEKLAIARDLGSHRSHREQFWKSARRLGHTDAFSPGRGYESFESSHSAFVQLGVRRVVAIEDSAFGGDEAPGPYTGTEDDALIHCSAESLEVVGEVSLAALGAIGKQLAKIDRYSVAPWLQPDPAQAAEPASTGSEPSASEPAGPVTEEPGADPAS